MAELTEDAIREIFGDKTFFKGLDYYEGGNVLTTVKIEKRLYAQVRGVLQNRMKSEPLSMK
ncbi:Uncharacterised protein [uncultured archaeon]|nr:Uncharacterised protein [uncultured archaeon]